MFDKINLKLLDLLTIFLPGGLMLMVILNIKPIGTIWSSWQSITIENWQKASLFVAASFVIGHFVYLIASSIDNLIFEKVRKVYYSGTKLLAYVRQLKKETLGIDDSEVINAYKWALAILKHKSPTLYEEAEKHIAASKFFRSFFVVLLIAFFALIINTVWIEAGVILILSFFSLVRYFNQRVKSIDSVYHYILILSEKKYDNEPDPAIVAELNKNYINITFSGGIVGHLEKVWVAFKLCLGWNPK